MYVQGQLNYTREAGSGGGPESFRLQAHLNLVPGRQPNVFTRWHPLSRTAGGTPRTTQPYKVDPSFHMSDSGTRCRALAYRVGGSV